jgi:homocysteine S-methyltransferase
VIGGSVNTSAANRDEELDRVAEKVRAGAHFLVTEMIYEPADTYQTLTQLRARGIELPVVVAVAARHDPVAIDRLGHEQPGVQLTESTLDAARRLGADPLLARDIALSTVQKLRPLIGGVLVSAPLDGGAELVDLVSRLR